MVYQMGVDIADLAADNLDAHAIGYLVGQLLYEAVEDAAIAAAMSAFTVGTEGAGALAAPAVIQARIAAFTARLAKFAEKFKLSSEFAQKFMSRVSARLGWTVKHADDFKAAERQLEKAKDVFDARRTVGKATKVIDYASKLTPDMKTRALSLILDELDAGNEFSQELAKAIRRGDVKIVFENLDELKGGGYLPGSNVLRLRADDAFHAINPDPAFPTRNLGLQNLASRAVHEGRHWADDRLGRLEFFKNFSRTSREWQTNRLAGEMAAHMEEIYFMLSRGYGAIAHDLLKDFLKGGIAGIRQRIIKVYNLNVLK